MNSLSYYSKHSLKSFFFDKYSFSNSYQMPSVNKLGIYIFFNNYNCSRDSVYKSLLFLYCIAGIKPLVCIKKVKVKGRGLKKKKITHLSLLLTGAALYSVMLFIISRQVPLIKFFDSFPLKSNKFSATLLVPLSDDDFLLQALQLTSGLKMQLSFSTRQPLVSLQQFRVFLIGWKMPACIVK